MESVSVIKVGGKIAEDVAVLNAFLHDLGSVTGPKVLVHGGGVIATKIGEKLGISSQMIEGRRVTDKETLEVATMVYGGLINKRIVAKLQSMGVNAIGLTGADLNVIEADKRPPEPIDFGWVGDIKKVNTDWLVSLIEKDVLPVMAPLTHDGNGNMLNTNADSIASFTAGALANRLNTRLVLCFDMPGVMENGKVIPEIDLKRYSELKASGVVKDGMIPKLDLGFQALNAGVSEVIIKSAKDLNDDKTGTVLRQ